MIPSEAVLEEIEQEQASQVPLIWTKYGNLPISSLKYEVAWDLQPPLYIKFVERYSNASGEVVKESAHVYNLQGVAGDGDVGKLL